MRGPIAAVGSMLLLATCNFTADAQNHDAKPSGQTGSRTFEVGSFDKIALGGPHNVVVTVGGGPSVRAEGDLGIIDKLDIRVEDGELDIGTKKGFSFSFKSDRSPVTVYVTLPALAAASIGGSGDMKIDKVAGDSFEAAIGGSGDMDIGAVQVKTASFSIGGSGGIRAKGKADSGDVSIAGSGDISLEGFEVQRTSVSVAGSGSVKARAMQSADISIIGSGDVELSGPAKCNISKMGSGEARCTG